VTKQGEAAAAARVAAGLRLRKRAELLELIRPAFGRTGPWLQAGKYLAAVMSDLPRRNGWTIARYCGDRSPDRTQRLQNRAVWDERAVAGAVRRFAVAGLDLWVPKTYATRRYSWMTPPARSFRRTRK